MVGFELAAGVAVVRWLLGRIVMAAMSGLAAVDRTFGKYEIRNLND